MPEETPKPPVWPRPQPQDPCESPCYLQTIYVCVADTSKSLWAEKSEVKWSAAGGREEDGEMDMDEASRGWM